MKLKTLACRHVARRGDTISMDGSLRNAGRWNNIDKKNDKKSFGALYLALSKATLKAEIERKMDSLLLPEEAYFANGDADSV